jgi:hypothetical protein
LTVMISAAKPPLSPTCSTGPHERSEPAHHLRASLVNIVATEPHRAHWLLPWRLLLWKAMPQWREISPCLVRDAKQWLQAVFARARTQSSRLSDSTSGSHCTTGVVHFAHAPPLERAAKRSVRLRSLSRAQFDRPVRTGLLSHDKRPSALRALVRSASRMRGSANFSSGGTCAHALVLPIPLRCGRCPETPAPGGRHLDI